MLKYAQMQLVEVIQIKGCNSFEVTHKYLLIGLQTTQINQFSYYKVSVIPLNHTMSSKRYVSIEVVLKKVF